MEETCSVGSPRKSTFRGLYGLGGWNVPSNYDFMKQTNKHTKTAHKAKFPLSDSAWLGAMEFVRWSPGAPLPYVCFSRKPGLLNRHRSGLLFWGKPKAAFWIPFQFALVVLTSSLDSANRSLNVMKDNYSNKTNLFNSPFMKIFEKINDRAGLSVLKGPGLSQLEFTVNCNLNFFLNP